MSHGSTAVGRCPLWHLEIGAQLLPVVSTVELPLSAFVANPIDHGRAATGENARCETAIPATVRPRSCEVRGCDTGDSETAKLRKSAPGRRQVCDPLVADARMPHLPVNSWGGRGCCRLRLPISVGPGCNPYPGALAARATTGSSFERCAASRSALAAPPKSTAPCTSRSHPPTHRLPPPLAVSW